MRQKVLRRAQGNYARLWKKAQPYLGGDQPEVEFSGQLKNNAGQDVNAQWNQNRVQLDRDTTRNLARKGGDPRRRDAKYTLLHEWAHSRQKQDIPSGPLREGGADIWARHAAHDIYGYKMARSRNPVYRKAFKDTYGPDYWQTGQFTTPGKNIAQ